MHYFSIETIVVLSAILHLVQLMALPFFQAKASDLANGRAKNAVRNFNETYIVFLVLALMSIHLDASSNVYVAAIWLLTRVLYFVVYAAGTNAKPAEVGASPNQPLRSIIWMASFLALIWMAVVSVINI